MAANPPPFQVEDNSDEDFFDKLVNDDDDTDFNVTGVVMDGDESDDARAFANLNINEHVDNGELSFDATGSSTSHDVGVSSTEIHDVPQISEVGTVGGSRNGMVTSDSFLFDKLMVDQADKGGANEESGSALLSSNSFEFDNLVHGHENVTGPTEGLSDATVVSKSSNDCLSDATAVGNNSVESAAPGVKQVDWSAFHSDSGQTAGNGFGSFSDFFDGENAGDAFESIVGDGLHNGPQIANVDNVHAPAPLENSTYTGQNDAYSYGVTADQSASYGVAADQSASYGVTADQSANPVYQNSNQSWDNLYPGWKYNQYTGEWYQVDGSDASASVSSHSDPYLSSGWGVSAGQAEVSYLQQNPYSAAGTVAEVGTVQSVTNWNQPSQVSDPVETTANWGQVSQAIVDTTTAQSQWNQASQDNNGYPQHMAFDPQYPGWYYNTITQQWCQLESYTVPTQSATQTQEQMHQSEFQSNDIYTQNNKQVSNSQTTYNAHGEGNSYMSQAFGKQGQDQNYSAHGEGNNFMSQGFGKQGQDQNYSAHGEGKSYMSQGFGKQGQDQNYSAHGEGKSYMSQGFGKQGQDQNYSAHGEGKSYMSQGFGKQGQDQNWSSPGNSYNHQPTVWQPEGLANSDPTSLHSGSHLKESHYGQAFPKTSGSKQISSLHGAASSYYENVNQVQNNFSVPSNSQSFHVGNNLSQVANDSRIKQNEQMHTSYENYNNQNSFTFSQHEMHKAPVSNNHALGRSSAGRPAHALAAFGFGGKLIMMKHNSSSENLSFGTQNPVGKYLSVLNLADVIKENVDASHNGMGVYNYFQALGRQSVPGPLTGGSVGTKELNKWIDERTANPVSLDMDYRKAEVLRLLLSLLRISCQYYGKLRSPYGSDAALKEIDAPELAVARLFASAKGNVSQLSQYGPQCLQQMPSEDQMQVSAAEVQSLLVSGKKKDALQCAQEGQLWGPALVLAAQLGDQFYVETVKQMALRQLVAGSPLRTLCLLIAGQPKDVFSADCSTSSSVDGVGIMPQQPAQAGVNIMLDDWEENLAVITANGTKGDDLVLLHLGDCLWKERSNVTAAHICYLVAEASFEHYSDSARLCLVGADHWKFPRTYASPEAIQRTEIYEYSKTLGNSQFVLLPFQPYKLVYAHMLAEVGRVSDALKYVQAVLKSLKTGRTAEVETLKHLASSLEERIKAHQQGGFSTNLAGSKLVGKLLNLFDSTASRVVGGLPPPAPALAGNVHGTENHFQPIGPRVSTSQSTLAMSSLVPSQSAEPVNSDNNKVAKHTRSVSEPDFGRTPRQGQTDSVKDASSTESKASTSRFRRFGLGYLQKTVGAVLSRPGRQAKLGDENKFYYDAKLGRWVEEGSEIPAEEAALPPPPPTAGFQNGTSDYNLKSALQTEVSQSNGSPEFKGPSPMDNNPGMPPLPPSTNQYSARGRIGVRSRYVDTFNQGGGNSTNSFQSPPSPSIKPLAVPKPTSFFMPAPLSPTVEQPIGSPVDNAQLMSPTQDYSPSSIPNNPPHSPAPLSSVAMQRFASMNNISMNEMRDGGSFTANSRRTASWGGNMNNSLFSPPPRSEARPLGEVLGMDSSSFEQPGSGHSRKTSGSYGDEMQEVDL